MAQLLEDLGIKLTPENKKLTSFKIKECGSKAVLRGWSWELTLELSGSSSSHERTGTYLTKPKVRWSINLAATDSLAPDEDLDRLKTAVALLME